MHIFTDIFAAIFLRSLGGSLGCLCRGTVFRALLEGFWKGFWGDLWKRAFEGSRGESLWWFLDRSLGGPRGINKKKLCGWFLGFLYWGTSQTIFFFRSVHFPFMICNIFAQQKLLAESHQDYSTFNCFPTSHFHATLLWKCEDGCLIFFFIGLHQLH